MTTNKDRQQPMKYQVSRQVGAADLVGDGRVDLYAGYCDVDRFRPMWRRVGTGLAAAAVMAALAGCSAIADAVDDGDSFEDRAEAIDAVYEQGKASRKSMEKTGIVVDEASCDSSWVTSGAKDAENDMDTPRNNRANDVNFQERRRLSFVNGCMDRPNSLPPINAPSLRPTTSGSATPSAAVPATSKPSASPAA